MHTIEENVVSNNKPPKSILKTVKFDEKSQENTDNNLIELTASQVSLGQSNMPKDDLGALLHVAEFLQKGHTAIIRQVLELDKNKSINVNAALIMAIEYKNGEIARLLADKGATNLSSALVLMQERSWFATSYQYLIDKIIANAELGFTAEEQKKLQEAAIYIIRNKQYAAEKLINALKVRAYLDSSALLLEALQAGNGDLIEILKEDKDVWRHIPSALVKMQSFKTRLGWREDSSYEGIYNSLIHKLTLKATCATLGTPLVENAAELMNCLKYIIHTSPEHAKNLLNTDYIRKQCDLDALLIEALTTKEKDSALISLLVEKSSYEITNVLPSGRDITINMQKIPDDKDEDKEELQKHVEVTLGARNILQAISFMQLSVSRTGWRSGSSYEETYFYLIKVLAKNTDALKTDSPEDKKTLRDIFVNLVKTTAAKDENNAIFLLSAKHVRDCLGADTRVLLSEVLQFGNGGLAKEIMDVYDQDIQTSFPSALVQMQSFKTKMGWRKGTYQDTYDHLINKLVTITTLVFDKEEKNKLLEALKYMIKKGEPQGRTLLACKHIRKQVDLNVLLLEALNAKNSDLVKLLTKDINNTNAQQLEQTESKASNILDAILLIQSQSSFSWSTRKEYEDTYFYLVDILKTDKDVLKDNGEEEKHKLKQILSNMASSGDKKFQEVVRDCLQVPHFIGYLGSEVNALLSELKTSGSYNFMIMLAKTVEPHLDSKGKEFLQYIFLENLPSKSKEIDLFFGLCSLQSVRETPDTFKKAISGENSPLIVAIQHGKIEIASSYLRELPEWLTLTCDEYIMAYEKAVQLKKENSSRFISSYKIPELSYPDFKKLKLKYIETWAEKVKVSSLLLTVQNQQCLKDIFFSAIYQGEEEILLKILPFWKSLCEADSKNFSLIQKGDESPLVMAIKCGKPGIAALLLKETDVEYDYVSAYKAAEDIKNKNKLNTMIPTPELTTEDLQNLKNKKEECETKDRFSLGITNSVNG